MSEAETDLEVKRQETPANTGAELLHIQRQRVMNQFTHDFGTAFSSFFYYNSAGLGEINQKRTVLLDRNPISIEATRKPSDHNQEQITLKVKGNSEAFPPHLINQERFKEEFKRNLELRTGVTPDITISGNDSNIEFEVSLNLRSEDVAKLGNATAQVATSDVTKAPEPLYKYL